MEFCAYVCVRFPFCFCVVLGCFSSFFLFVFSLSLSCVIDTVSLGNTKEKKRRKRENLMRFSLFTACVYSGARRQTPLQSWCRYHG
ncbi:hypothetical protein TCDM_04377 [Trypanosoma cruzi Dm28c]|uniref:Uncharacterized protein n=1 Tax=Trypanosoma cruzi Dm28c TaxID=1416333 RepID=V5BLH5_TRYCR|nr:hypothetical protein TCDM_04377 [Trypanosoma cruzi Dm28c]